MATTINQTPTSPNAAYTKLFYSVSSDIITQPQFQFVMDVKVGGELIKRSTQIPNTDGYAIFDPSRTIQDYLKYDNYWKTIGAVAADESYQTFDINFGEQWGISLSSSINIYPEQTSASIHVFPGVVIQTQDESYNYNTSSITTTTNILTNAPTLTSGINKYEDIPVLSMDDFHTITLLNEDISGLNISLLEYSPSGVETVLTSSIIPGIDSKFATYGVGPQNLISSNRSFTELMCQKTKVDNCNMVRIEPIGSGSGNFYYYKLLEDSCQISCQDDYTRFAFINRYGFWDYYNVFNPSRISVNVDRYTTTNPPTSYSGITALYNVNTRGEKQYYLKTENTYSIDTEYLSKLTSNWLEELLESPSVYIQVGSEFVPIVIKTSSYKTNNEQARNKLYKYTIDWTFANIKQEVEVADIKSPPPSRPAPTPSPTSTPSISISPTPSSTPAVYPMDPNAEDFIDAIGTLDSTQTTAINVLVTELKNNGLWDCLDVIYPVIGGTESAHKFNLKDPRDLDVAKRLLFSGSWAHSSTGMKPTYSYPSFPDSGSWADTFHRLDLVSGSQDSLHMSYYSRTDVDQDRAIEMGVSFNPVLPVYSIINYSYLSGTPGLQMMNSLYNPVTTSFTKTTGLLIGNRRMGTLQYYFRGTKVHDYLNESYAGGSRTIYLGAMNNASLNKATNHSNKECAFATIGCALSDSDALNLYNIIQSYQTTLGRQIEPGGNPPGPTPSISVTPSTTPSSTPSISSTPNYSLTPSISATPNYSLTPSISVTPSVTPSISISPTPSPSYVPCFTVSLIKTDTEAEQCAATTTALFKADTSLLSTMTEIFSYTGNCVYYAPTGWYGIGEQYRYWDGNGTLGTLQTCPSDWCTQIILGTSGVSGLSACSRYSSSPVPNNYINNVNFMQATRLTYDNCNDESSAAYYSDGSNWRYWNGTIFTTSGSCS